MCRLLFSFIKRCPTFPSKYAWYFAQMTLILNGPWITFGHGFFIEEIEASTIKGEANFRETLDLDSLDYVDLVVFVEENFKVKLTAEDCIELNIVDEIVEEMPGGAHRYPKEQFLLVKQTILANLKELVKLPVEKIVTKRNEKFLNITLN